MDVRLGLGSQRIWGRVGKGFQDKVFGAGIVAFRPVGGLCFLHEGHPPFLQNSAVFILNSKHRLSTVENFSEATSNRSE